MACLARRFAFVVLLALLGGCALLNNADTNPAAPRSHVQWAALAGEIRAFERRIGFDETNNFRRFSDEKSAFTFCGHASRLYLPYSYEDPAIEWLDSVTEQECRKFGRSEDVVFVVAEALGKVETPVTPSILAAPLERLVYVVIHENCHEQFDLPYGIEEALCNLIAYKAMAAFGEERFRSMPAQSSAIQRYAREGSERSHLALTFYEQLAALYARHDRREMSSQTLLKQRQIIFRKAERELSRPKGSMSNVWMANTMTYSRHYPLVERVFDALGRDLARTILFFRYVDSVKPSEEEVTARHGLNAQSGLDFIRAYEAAVAETIEHTLANGNRMKPNGV